tara:strand:+ start:14080 stop:14931 length:852 start_codon:yes stop_codon:yes gene_type:complete
MAKHVIETFLASPLLRGFVTCPYCSLIEDLTKEVLILKNEAALDLLPGTIHTSKNYGDFKVVDYRSTRSIVVQFVDTGCLVETNARVIRATEIKDYLRPSIYGVGFLGIPQSKIDKKTYGHWISMLQRCYAGQEFRSSYLDKSVSVIWHNYSKFLDWSCSQVGFDKSGYQLDKDILLKGNKEYGPEVCCFVPQKINSLLLGANKIRGDLPIGVHRSKKKYAANVCDGYGNQIYLGVHPTPIAAFQAYKEAKEIIIKKVATEYKNDIDHRVYSALMQYSVEITD